jgi:hypothetical protein
MPSGAAVYAFVHIFEEKYREKSDGEIIATIFNFCMACGKYSVICGYNNWTVDFNGEKLDTY